MSFLSSIFGGGSKNNPANAAQPYLNKIEPLARENFNPYIEGGQAQMKQNQDIYSRMAGNPIGFLDELKASYTPSRGYQFKEDRYRKAAENAAAAGGSRGSPADVERQTRLVQGLLGEDEGAYLDRVLGIQGTGLQGNEFGANRAFQGSSDLTNILGSTYGQQGALAYKGQEAQNKTRQDFTKMLMQLLGGAAGFAVGGPMGAAVGANIGGGSMSYPQQSAEPTNNQQFGKGIPWLGGNF
jgi:hypothetical protein